MTETTYRNRHYRGHTQTDSLHAGRALALDVVTSSAIGAHPAGTSIETIFADFQARLAVLEALTKQYGDFALDAYVPAWFKVDSSLLRTLTFTYVTDSIIKATVSENFTGDARIMPVLYIDAYLAEFINFFTGDAIIKKVVEESTTLYAWKVLLSSSSFTADAISRETFTPTPFSANAWVDNGSALYGFLVDALVRSTISSSVTSDAIKLATRESGVPGVTTVRYGTYQSVPNVAGTYTQNMDVGTNPKVVGVFVLGWGTSSGSGISTWTFDGGSTLSYVTRAEYLGTRTYLFHNTSPSSMSGTVEVKLVLSQGWGALNFVPFAIENGDTMSQIDVDTDAGAALIYNYVVDTGITSSVGLTGITGGTSSPTAAMTSFFASPSGYDAAYETSAPSEGSRNLGFGGSGSHAWVGVTYSTGSTSAIPSPTADAVILATTEASFTAGAVLAPLGFTADAVISSAAASVSSSTLGEFQLGSTSLGE